MNYNKAFQILVEAKNILNSLNVECQLSSGTLLGYYRDNKIIENDYDIDLAIKSKDYSANIIKEFLLNDWILITNHCNNEFGDRQISIKKKKVGVKLDIFVLYEENDKMYEPCWTRFWFKENEKWISIFNAKRFIYDKYDFKEIIWDNEKFCIPDKPEMYLKNIYGDSWTTKIENWSWSRKGVSKIKTNNDFKIYLKDLKYNPIDKELEEMLISINQINLYNKNYE